MFPANIIRRAIKLSIFPRFSQDSKPVAILIQRLVSTSERKQFRFHYLWRDTVFPASRLTPTGTRYLIFPNPNSCRDLPGWPILRQIVFSLECARTWKFPWNLWSLWAARNCSFCALFTAWFLGDFDSQCFQKRVSRKLQRDLDATSNQGLINKRHSIEQFPPRIVSCR